MKKMPPALKAVLFFIPEIVICLFILVRPELLEAFMFFVAKHVFAPCLPCLDSPQFLLSSSLLLLCLLSHLMRFLVFRLAGNSLLADHKSSTKEILISLLISVAYLVFLINSLSNKLTIEKNSLGIFDVVGASVTALAFVVISIFVFSTLMKKEK